jgi:hypothetical protein
MAGKPIDVTNDGRFTEFAKRFEGFWRGLCAHVGLDAYRGLRALDYYQEANLSAQK